MTGTQTFTLASSLHTKQKQSTAIVTDCIVNFLQLINCTRRIAHQRARSSEVTAALQPIAEWVHATIMQDRPLCRDKDAATNGLAPCSLAYDFDSATRWSRWHVFALLKLLQSRAACLFEL
jgi:hypothetical protein